MRPHIKIESLDTGFTLYLFDETGQAENDKNIFCLTKKEILKKIDEWWKV